MEDNERLEAIQKTFQILDKDGDKNISIKELERFILNQGMNIPQEELQQLIESVDINQDGNIQYSEFEQIMLKMMNDEDEDSICKQIFNSIDRKNDNQITADELKYAFYCLGEMLTEEEIRFLIHTVSGGNDFVTYENFCKIFKETQNNQNK